MLKFECAHSCGAAQQSSCKHAALRHAPDPFCSFKTASGPAAQPKLLLYDDAEHVSGKLQHSSWAHDSPAHTPVQLCATLPALSAPDAHCSSRLYEDRPHSCGGTQQSACTQTVLLHRPVDLDADSRASGPAAQSVPFANADSEQLCG